MDQKTNIQNTSDDRRLASATHTVLEPLTQPSATEPAQNTESVNLSPLQQFNFDCDTTEGVCAPKAEAPHSHHTVTIGLLVAVGTIFASGAAAAQFLL